MSEKNTNSFPVSTSSYFLDFIMTFGLGYYGYLTNPNPTGFRVKIHNMIWEYDKAFFKSEKFIEMVQLFDEIEKRQPTVKYEVSKAR